MEQRVAIVTGGLRGLGRAMALGLVQEGHAVVAVGHIDADVTEIKATTAGTNFAGKILPLSPICAGRPIATASLQSPGSGSAACTSLSTMPA